jgi:hypothetical protein
MHEQKSVGTQLIELMRDSVITQALVTIIVTVATVGLLWEGKPVPGELWALDGLVVGIYFGGKVQSGAARLAEKHAAQIAEAQRGADGAAERGGVG